MDEYYNRVCGIDKLAELLIERGIEFYVNDEVSLVFKDDVGNLHECWKAGADDNRVNALIVVTPEQLLSVPDLNGIIAENVKLREQVVQLQVDWESEHDYANQMEAKEKRAVSENDKLRRLAKAAWDCVNRHISCDECRMVCCGCTLQSAIRELGMEVK